MNGIVKCFNGMIGKIIGEDNNIYFMDRRDLLDKRSRFTKGKEVVFDVLSTRGENKRYDRAINISYIRKRKEEDTT